jgi:hypothetical protein
LGTLFAQRRREPDAMSGHMEFIRELVRGLGDCAEFGVRRANSTLALLEGCTGSVHSYDVERLPEYEPILKEVEHVAGPRWQFHLQSSLEADLPPCDALVIDSLHNYDQVRAELARHAGRVRKYLIFHDTMSCCCRGQSASSGELEDRVLGIRPAIDHFMIEHRGEWEIIAHRLEHAGLLVLERVAR